MTTASAPTPTRDSAIAGWLPPPGGHRTMDPPPEPLFLTLARGLDRLAGHRAWRRATLGALELGIALLAALAALLIVQGAQRGPWWGEAAWPAAFLVLAKVVAGVFTGAFGCRWRYVGLRDALLVLRSTVVAAAAGLAGIAWLDPAGDGLRLVVADAALYLLLSGGLRLSARWLHQRERRVRAVTGNQLRRTVIVGAGEAGALLLERMLASPKMLMDPVALVDDDANMHGSRLHGVPIVGPVSELGAIADRLCADETIIAVPSASTEQMARIVDSCVAAGLPFRIAPDPEDMLGMHPGTSGLRDLRPSDLLGRAQQEFDVAPVRAELRQARVVITGAAGSIGSELARQIVKAEPAALYLVDRNENDLHYLCEEFRRHQITLPFRGIIEDVRDQSRLAWLLKDLRATHLFHAAAFKHVPLMESHAVAAVENNILGTWSALQAANAAGVRKFVLISSDKAVRPRNVMGATKRFAEVLVAEATRGSAMDGIIVRFGNVLGSNGSVVPLFQRQISEGGPVTVTSRNATRYFMTPSEAAQLVLQAAAMPECAGNIAILDMGTPVHIWDLAERMIRMSGLRPGADIAIVETGLRRGEKLHEELWSVTEDAAPSSNSRIMLAEIRCPTHQATSLIPLVRQLVNLGDPAALLDLLARSVGLTSQSAGLGHGSPGGNGRTARTASVA
jgi:FlaA1/EpsC-like NDP-sugar epimerase